MTVPLCGGGSLTKRKHLLKKKRSFRLVRPRLRPPFFRTCVLKEGLPSECSFDGASAKLYNVRAHVSANKKALRRLGKTVQGRLGKSGKHIATVYRRAEKLGRLPTLEELKEKKTSPGRPKKYKY